MKNILGLFFQITVLLKMSVLRLIFAGKRERSKMMSATYEGVRGGGLMSTLELFFPENAGIITHIIIHYESRFLHFRVLYVGKNGGHYNILKIFHMNYWVKSWLTSLGGGAELTVQN